MFTQSLFNSECIKYDFHKEVSRFEGEIGGFSWYVWTTLTSAVDSHYLSLNLTRAEKSE